MLLGHLQWRILEVLWAAGHPGAPDQPVAPVSVPTIMEALQSQARPVARTSINAAVGTLAAAAKNSSRTPLVVLTREGRTLLVTALQSRAAMERDLLNHVTEVYFGDDPKRVLRAVANAKQCDETLQTELLSFMATLP